MSKMLAVGYDGSEVSDLATLTFTAKETAAPVATVPLTTGLITTSILPVPAAEIAFHFQGVPGVAPPATQVYYNHQPFAFASKAAVQRLTGVAQKEYGGEGIRVFGLSPGTVATDMQVAIKASGVNPVSQLDPSVHIPAEWVARGLAFLCGPDADGYQGTDFSLKSAEGREKVGLPPL